MGQRWGFRLGYSSGSCSSIGGWFAVAFGPAARLMTLIWCCKHLTEAGYCNVSVRLYNSVTFLLRSDWFCGSHLRRKFTLPLSCMLSVAAIPHSGHPTRWCAGRPFLTQFCRDRAASTRAKALPHCLGKSRQPLLNWTLPLSGAASPQPCPLQRPSGGDTAHSRAFA